MAKKTPPYPEYPAWTTARFYSFLRSALRRAWVKWPPRWEALRAARRAVSGKKGVRHKYEYLCALCYKWYEMVDVEVDHIDPVGSLQSLEDLPRFIGKLLVGTDKLRVLCKICHLKETHKK